MIMTLTAEINSLIEDTNRLSLALTSHRECEAKLAEAKLALVRAEAYLDQDIREGAESEGLKKPSEAAIAQMIRRTLTIQEQENALLVLARAEREAAAQLELERTRVRALGWLVSLSAQENT